MADKRPKWSYEVRADAISLLPETVGRVLDVGGGDGTTAAYLRKEKRATYAVVIDGHVFPSNPGVDRMLQGDLEDRSVLARVFKDEGPFDTVLFLDVLEHLKDPWIAVATAFEHLRPGGICLVSVPNARFVSLLGPLVFRGDFTYTNVGVLDSTHLRWFTAKSLKRLLEGAGFEVVGRKGNLGERSRILNTATFGLLRDFFEFQIIACGRKPG